MEYAEPMYVTLVSTSMLMEVAQTAQAIALNVPTYQITALAASLTSPYLQMGNA